MNEKEIRVKYKTRHDKLTASYYGGTTTLTKEQFDLQHGQSWADMETELTAGGFMEAPKPVRDLVAEIDELRARIAQLEGI